MPISSYTSPDAIRAALGVSALELKDATLSLQMYEDNLLLDLAEIGQGAASALAALVQTPSTDEVQLQFLRAGRLFATYSVANHLLSALPLFSPKEITDGKASLVRYADGPYNKVIEEVRARYTQYQAAAAAAYAATQSAQVTESRLPTYMRSSRGVDPVTGV